MNERINAMRGTDLPQAKLDDSKVRAIREMHAIKLRKIKWLQDNYSVQAMARRYGVHPRTIEKVLMRETWVHVR